MNKKSYYDIKVDFLIPTTITYRVSALSEQEALKEVDKSNCPKTAIRQHMASRIKLKATVYTPGTNMIKLSKIYRGHG